MVFTMMAVVPMMFVSTRQVETLKVVAIFRLIVTRLARMICLEGLQCVAGDPQMDFRFVAKHVPSLSPNGGAPKTHALFVLLRS